MDGRADGLITEASSTVPPWRQDLSAAKLKSLNRMERAPFADTCFGFIEWEADEVVDK